MIEVPAFSKLLHTVLVPKPQNTQEPDHSAPPSIFPSASLLKVKENWFQILQTHWLPYLVAGPLRNTILATRVMFRTTPGNRLIQSSEKLGATSQGPSSPYLVVVPFLGSCSYQPRVRWGHARSLKQLKLPGTALWILALARLTGALIMQ